MFDRWQQMQWFVTLADTDLAAQSEGDIKNWQDACEAIHLIPLPLTLIPTRVGGKECRPCRGWTGPDSPTRDQLEEIQEAIAQPLKDLADGKADIDLGGRVSMSESFQMHRQKGSGLPFITSEIEVEGYGNWRDDFVLRVRRLLATFITSIRRCPHCGKVFLQLRKNATYCGPACYSVAGMRKLREKKLAEKAAKLKGKTPKKGTRR